MHTVHNWWLKTGEYACPVFDIVDIFCELPDLQACRVHELCPESFKNSELIQDLGKLQIQRHGSARGGRWANKKHFKCEMQSLNKLEAYARDKCAGRCDVKNTEQSPQTLPQSQKPSRVIWWVWLLTVTGRGTPAMLFTCHVVRLLFAMSGRY